MYGPTNCEKMSHNFIKISLFMIISNINIIVKYQATDVK